MTPDLSKQPVSSVEWVPRDSLRANDYNPNHVAPPELELLRLSIVNSGWTQPIVARPDGEIVDGFHRWTVSGHPTVRALTGGLVPVVRIAPEVGEQKMATIRHNRARGSHAVLRMAEIVRDLIDKQGMTPTQVQTLLGMEDEEVERLYDRGGMVKRGAREGFNKGWEPE